MCSKINGIMGTLQEMAYMMREQVATAHQMMDQLGRQHKVGREGNPNGPKVNLEHLKLAEFQEVNLPNFWGSFDLEKVEEWVKAIEKVFFHLGLY